MAEAAQNSAVPQLKIVIPNKHSEKLVGILHETGSAEIVILCHGFRASKDETTMVHLAFALENEGISSFRFDFAENGAISPGKEMLRKSTIIQDIFLD